MWKTDVYTFEIFCKEDNKLYIIYIVYWWKQIRLNAPTLGLTTHQLIYFSWEDESKKRLNLPSPQRIIVARTRQKRWRAIFFFFLKINNYCNYQCYDNFNNGHDYHDFHFKKMITIIRLSLREPEKGRELVIFRMVALFLDNGIHPV